MSHSFYVGGASSLTYEHVLSALDADRLRYVEGDAAELAGPWPTGRCVHLYRWGMTTRSIEASLEDGVFNVRILVGSCPHDYRLALAMVTAAARAVNGTISSEDGVDDVGADAVDEHWGPQWLEEHSHGMVRSILSIAESSQVGDVLTMNGPVREFALGPRVLARLRGGPDEGVEERLFADMRRLQYIAAPADDGDGVYCANAMSMRRDEDGPEVRFAVWGPGVSYLIPPVDLLALNTDERIMVPVTAAETLAPGRVEYLDEKHVRIGEVPESDWDEVVAAARSLAVDPFGA